jgi:predicted O-linked N-acetylglucosamine transferase (SPINDLY family)
MGNSFASRVAGSLLHAIGLPELTTHNLKDYEALAVKLATTPELLIGIRTKLAKNRLSSPLFNTQNFRQYLEAAYITMWEKYQRGEKPASFAVPAINSEPSLIQPVLSPAIKFSTTTQKIGRNDLCPCGSGKKYKKCCYSKPSVQQQPTTVALNDENSIRQALENGLAHQKAGRLAEAEIIYTQVLQHQPNNADALHFLGLLAHQQGKNEIAEQLIRKSLAVVSNPVAYSNLGLVLGLQNKLDEAVQNYQTAITLQPNYAEAYNNLAAVYGKQGKFALAVANYRQAVLLKPDYAMAYNNLAVSLKNQGNLNEAAENFHKALTIIQTDPSIYYNYANVLNAQKNFSEASENYRKALALKADYIEAQSALLYLQQHNHDWQDYAANLKKVLQAVQEQKFGSTPLSFLRLSDSPALQLQCAKVYAATEHPPALTPLWTGQRYSHDKIRVAYLSADLGDHPVSILMIGAFEAHDKERFEFIALSLRKPADSPLGQRVKQAFEQFIDVSDKSDNEIAALIQELEIDILVDLMGFTRHCRSRVFAQRPAPVQVNYLGFPGTMGASYIDYIIADKLIIPPEKQPFYTEKVVYLPDTYMPNDATRVIAGYTPTRTEAGLPESGFVFCSFNDHYKITPEIFAVWIRLLKQVENSVLWLRTGNAVMKSNLQNAVMAHGIAPERLVFAQKVDKMEEHLARNKVADLFLDTLPYNAHATACDALWAGLPVLTCRGESFASRVAGSLLQAVGLPELITDNLKDYEAMALKLATNPELLAEIRVKLANNRLTYPLFDTKRFTRNLEKAYFMMWEKFQRGELPDSLSV